MLPCCKSSNFLFHNFKRTISSPKINAMKQLSFLFNRKNTSFVLGNILLSSLALQSCSDEMKVSLDTSHVQYEIMPAGGIRRKSPSAEDLGFNIALWFMIGGAQAQNQSGFLGNPKFNNSSLLYARSEKIHGPSFEQNTGLEQGDLNFNNNASSRKGITAANNIRFMVGPELIEKGGDGNHLFYVEVPLEATYWVNLSNGKVFGGLGPYVAYGFGSAFDRNSFSPFDAGLTINGGYKMNNSFSFSVGYDFGLLNISKDINNTPFLTQEARNRTISFNIGYPLNKLIKK